MPRHAPLTDKHILDLTDEELARTQAEAFERLQALFREHKVSGPAPPKDLLKRLDDSLFGVEKRSWWSSWVGGKQQQQAASPSGSSPTRGSPTAGGGCSPRPGACWIICPEAYLFHLPERKCAVGA